MRDVGHEWTDEQIAQLAGRFSKEYSQAAREMQKKLEKALADYGRENSQRLKALDGTPQSQKLYEEWKRDQAVSQTWMRDMVHQLSESATHANMHAADMINDFLPHAYAENANMAAFALEKQLGYDAGFTLVNEDAVRYLMGLPLQNAGDDQLLREVTWTPSKERLHVQDLRKREVDYPKDMRWNREKFQSAITQGILQGESIPSIVKRTKDVYGRNKVAATRAARTATTNAENAGRMNTFERAQRLGIDMEIEWLATPDGRTRSSHRALDGERIQLGEKFSNGLRWPADPYGPASEIWNCRCRANGRVVGFDGKRGDWADERGERWTRLPKGMTYDDWKKAKAVSREESYKNPSKNLDGLWPQRVQPQSYGVVDGKSILDTWKRRPDEYDFEIEDVMATQGFDGKPRIVGAEEFDNAVKLANGGNGLVMQRTYTAPDKDTLEAYRNMLYHGKWYVDCSEGGAQYGQGMYTAADYSGKVTHGMKSEMQHYVDLGKQRHPFQTFDMLSEDKKSEMIDESVARLGLSGKKAEAAKTMIGYELKVGDYDWGQLSAAHQKLSGVDYMSEVANLRAYRSEPSSYIETMTLDPSARIIEFGEIGKVKADWQGSLFERTDLSDERRRELYTMANEMDNGSFAAAMGYDAINAVGHGESDSYTVVLNRTKLIIRRPE